MDIESMRIGFVLGLLLIALAWGVFAAVGIARRKYNMTGVGIVFMLIFMLLALHFGWML